VRSRSPNADLPERPRVRSSSAAKIWYQERAVEIHNLPPLRSYWWRIYRVVPLSAVLRVYTSMQGAYALLLEVPQDLASLSAWAIRQGRISRRRGRRGARPGSVQYAFRHDGPP
jgi:hypothetical protein